MWRVKAFTQSCRERCPRTFSQSECYYTAFQPRLLIGWPNVTDWQIATDWLVATTATGWLILVITATDDWLPKRELLAGHKAGQRRLPNGWPNASDWLANREWLVGQPRLPIGWHQLRLIGWPTATPIGWRQLRFIGWPNTTAEWLSSRAHIMSVGGRVPLYTSMHHEHRCSRDLLFDRLRPGTNNAKKISTIIWKSPRAFCFLIKNSLNKKCSLGTNDANTIWNIIWNKPKNGTKSVVQSRMDNLVYSTNSQVQPNTKTAQFVSLYVPLGRVIP